MVFVKHNSRKSDIFFNPIFIPGFSGSRFFRVQVQGPDPGSRVRVQILEVALNGVWLKFQCGFRKGFGTQNCILYVIETIRKTRDNHGVFTAVVTNLSKAFDCISHELLVAKLHAYGFDESLLKVIISYLKNRTPTTKVGLSFSDLLNIIYGVPQGWILGPLLFIIYVCDLFIVNKEVII